MFVLVALPSSIARILSGTRRSITAAWLPVYTAIVLDFTHSFDRYGEFWWLHTKLFGNSGYDERHHTLWFFLTIARAMCWLIVMLLEALRTMLGGCTWLRIELEKWRLARTYIDNQPLLQA